MKLAQNSSASDGFGKTETCKCNNPKRSFNGLCDKCSDKGSNKTASVFVLEDDPARVSAFKAAFGNENVVVSKNVKASLDLLRNHRFAKVFLGRDLSSPTETGEDVAWQMEREALCRTTPVVIHSENIHGQKIMAKYLGRYHSNVTVKPFRQLRNELEDMAIRAMAQSNPPAGQPAGQPATVCPDCRNKMEGTCRVCEWKKRTEPSERQLKYCYDILRRIKECPADGDGQPIFETSMFEADKFIRQNRHSVGGNRSDVFYGPSDPDADPAAWGIPNH